MKHRLFDRLPEIWRRLDRPDPINDPPGVLERFLGVIDAGFAVIGEKVRGLWDLRNVEKIPDRYLRLLADQVGHDWRDDRSYEWNRRRVQHAIRRHSYRGTMERLGDLVEECGGGPWRLVDMASTLLTLDLQGTLGGPAAYLPDPDYYADGHWVLEVTPAVNLDELARGLLDIVPAGEVWTIQVVDQESVIFETVGSSASMGITHTTNAHEYDLGHGELDDDLWITLASVGAWKAAVSSGESGIAGGSITLDSPYFLDRDDIYLDMGSPDNPLSELMALEQRPTKIV